MKKLNLLALALVFGTVSLFAKDFEADIPVTEIRSQIVELVKSPDFVVKEELVVNVTFTFGPERDIIVLKVDSKDREVLDYINDNINHKMIQTPGETHKKFMLPIRIKN